MAPAKKTQASVESARNGKVPPVFEPVSIFFEKKVRNLEKRKTKLDGYRALQKEGKLTDLGQKQAVAKYDEVAANLTFASTIMQELLPVLMEISNGIEKNSVDKEKEKDKQCKSVMRFMLDTQDLYEQLGDPVIRKDFSSGNENATLLSEDQLATIDKHYLTSKPSRSNEDGTFKSKTQYKKSLDESVLSWHRIYKSNPAGEGDAKCEDLKGVFERIASCDYFDGSKRVVEVPKEAEPEITTPVEVTTVVEQEPEPVVINTVAQPPPPQEDYQNKPQVASDHVIDSLQTRMVNFVQDDYEHITNNTSSVSSNIIAAGPIDGIAAVATSFNGGFQDNYTTLPNNIHTMSLDNRQHFGHFNGNAFNQDHPNNPNPVTSDVATTNMNFSNTTPQGTFPAAESWADETPEPVYDSNMNNSGSDANFVEVKRGAMNQRYSNRPNEYGRGGGGGGYRNDYQRGMNRGNRGGGFESRGGFNRPYRNDDSAQGGMRQDQFFPRGGGNRGFGGGGKEFSSRGNFGQGNRGANRSMRGNFERPATGFTNSNSGEK